MGNKLILLVENDMNLQHSVLLMLQRAGHLITATDSACEALEILQSDKYHLLISDMDTPETGNLLIPKALGSYPHLSIVILTDQPIAEIETPNEGQCPRYLSKPIDPKYILDCVEEILSEEKCNNHPASSYKTLNYADKF